MYVDFDLDSIKNDGLSTVPQKGLDLSHDASIPQFTEQSKSLLALHYDKVNLFIRTPDLYSLQQVKNRLAWKKGREVFDEMWLDDMVRQGTQAWAASIAQDGRFQPSDDTFECKLICDKYTQMFRSMPGGFLENLRAMFIGARHGFSVHEKIFGLETEGPLAGFIVLKALKYLFPNFLFPCFEGDKLVGLWQFDSFGPNTQYNFIDINKVLHWVHHPSEDPFAGESIYVPAHSHWQAKGITKMLMANNSEMASGKLVTKHVRGNEQLPRLTEGEFDIRAKQIIENYLRFNGFKLWNGIEVDFIQSKTPIDAYNNLYNLYDKGILRSIGPPWLILEEGQFSTRSQAETLDSGFEQRIAPLRQSGEELFMDRNGPIQQVAIANGWSLRHVPTFTMKKSAEVDQRETIKVFLESERAENIQDSDRNEIRERIGWPKIGDKKQAVQAAVSLNGAQIQSAVLIINSTLQNGLPAETAKAMIGGFLPIPKDVVDSIIAPIQELQKNKASLPQVAQQINQNPSEPNTKSDRLLFADNSKWWKRPLTMQEKRFQFKANEAGLDTIIAKFQSKLNREWDLAMDSFERDVQSWIRSSKVSPAEMLKRIQSYQLNLDMFEETLYQCGVEAWKFGGRQAVQELNLAGIANLTIPSGLKFSDAKAGPSNPFDLGNFKGLLKAQAFEVREGFQRKALTAIANSLMTTYRVSAGQTDLSEAVNRIGDVFNGLISGKFIDPGTPGHDITKKAIKETTVRTLTADSFDSARMDLFKKNSDYVQGIMRSEVADGLDYSQDGTLRSAEVSQYIDGIKIKLDDPRLHYFVGARSFNCRGVCIPLTVKDDQPIWSTDEEIEYAIQKGKELSPRFFT